MEAFKKWIYTGTFGIRIDIVLMLLRIVFGALMMMHGYHKLLNIISGQVEFADPIGIGESLSLYLTVFAEFFCSILLIIGLMTRLAIIPLMITMLVALFIVHQNDPLGEKEIAILYLIGFYAIYLAGPGGLSMDAKLFKTKTNE